METEIKKSLSRPSDDFISKYVKKQGVGFDKILVEYEIID